MGKYEPLARHLRGLAADVWDASFADVEGILGSPLPNSAHEYPAWWANQDPGHSQTRGWSDVGWETALVDLRGKKLRFRRRKPRAESSGGAPSPAPKPRPDLWEQARVLTGIEDREELIEAALTALIRREAAKGLIALGGTMPDFAVPPRERPAV